jgi:type II secretory pathway component PulC
MTPINLKPATLIALSLGCLVILFMTTMLYAVFGWQDDWKLVQKITPPTKNIVNKDANAGLIATIADHHLFGKNFAKTGEVPFSNLQISLTGIVKVVKENNHAFSKAYISVAGAPSKIYQTGDTLPSGARIYNITSQEIILDNDGQLEKLRLPREQLQFKPRETKVEHLSNPN